MEAIRVSFDDLVNGPVLNLKDDEANVFGIEYEIRFSILDVGQVPRQVAVIRPGTRLEKPVESALAGCGERLDVVGDHRGHMFPPSIHYQHDSFGLASAITIGRNPAY